MKNLFIRQQIYFLLGVKNIVFENPRIENYWNKLNKNFRIESTCLNALVPPLEYEILDYFDQNDVELLETVTENGTDQIVYSLSAIYSQKSIIN